MTDCDRLLPPYPTMPVVCPVTRAGKGAGVSDDKVLQADLDAMGKIGPHLQTTAREIRGRIPASDHATPGADPGLAALEAFSKAISDVERIGAARLETISDVYDEAHKAFVTAEQLHAGYYKLPSIYQPPLRA